MRSSQSHRTLTRNTPSALPNCPECQHLKSADLISLEFCRELRHQKGVFEQEEVNESKATWRLRERMKTANCALIMCLNLGTDPPDVVKTSPCARKECWIDPTSTLKIKAREGIGKALQEQYEKLQPRARYKLIMDPTAEDFKKLCLSLRRYAKNDRVLFHYNGHGVPRPTTNAELWVFNRTYTQYIPLSVYDFKSWAGSPSIYVLDCSGAGLLLPHFLSDTNLIVPEADSGQSDNPEQEHPKPPGGDIIVLLACSANELLPMNPEYPADIFTSCLTTPISMALRWFIQHSMSMKGVDPNWVDEIPGKISDRKTPLGELNWIFISITDTIAWNSLPAPLFQKLYRDDSLVASLFRNFLLANRILRMLNCTPVSFPKLPPTHQHPLWHSWDFAVETCLTQLRKVHVPSLSPCPSPVDPGASPHPPLVGVMVDHGGSNDGFFKDQLTAFEVWLDFGRTCSGARPPEQLPIVLQVLLSQPHRLRALVLIRRFLDLGSWAVDLALSVGIFPYVRRLLQAPTGELRQVLGRIWARILAFDPSCQTELMMDGHHMCFIGHLSWIESRPQHSIIATFIIAAIMDNHPPGQSAYLREGLLRSVSALLETQLPPVENERPKPEVATPSPLLKQWLCLCIAKLCWGFAEARAACIRDGAVQLVLRCMSDSTPEVRCASAYVLAALFSSADRGYGQGKDEEARNQADIAMATQLAEKCLDGSPLVRREVVLALAVFTSNPTHIHALACASQAETDALHAAEGIAAVLAKGKKAPKDGEQEGGTLPSEGSYEERSVGSISPSRGGRKYVDEGIWVGLPGLKVGGDAWWLTEGGHWQQLVNAVSGRLVPSLGSQAAMHYACIWLTLRRMHRREPFPAVLEAVNELVSYIIDHAETVDIDTPMVPPCFDPLAGIPRGTTDPSAGSSMFRRIRSDGPWHDRSAFHANNGFRTNEDISARNSPLLENLSKPQFIHSFYRWSSRQFHDLPPISSEPLLTASTGVHGEGRVSLGGPAIGPLLPPPYPHGHVALDPLTHQGSLFLYFMQRNILVQEEAEILASVHQSLAVDPAISAVNSGISRMRIGSFFDSDDEYDGRIGKRTVVGRGAHRSLRLEQTAILDSNAPTSALSFHPYESLLAVADDAETVSTWNFDTGLCALKLCNGHQKGSRMTALHWLNPATRSLLLVGSDDGMVRIWDGMMEEHPGTPPRLVTAFPAAPDILTGQRGSGLVTHWQQTTGFLYSGGNSSLLRVWDLTREQAIVQWPTMPNSCVTALAAPLVNDISSGGASAGIGNVIGTVVAGHGDGMIRLYDSREGPDRPSRTFTEHGSWIVSLYFTTGLGGHEMLSACAAGDVRFWDIRMHSSLSAMSVQRSPMTALAAHARVPVLASGSHNQFINVLTLDGEFLTGIRYHEGFLGQRIGPISALDFHPNRLVLAAGATDSIVSVYTGGD